MQVVVKSYSNEPLQIFFTFKHIALRMNIPKSHPLPITLCSINIPLLYNTNSAEISSFFQSLPPPYTICGDFSVHNPTWGIKTHSTLRIIPRGNIIGRLLLSSLDILLLNTTGTQTHFSSSSGTLSTMDPALGSYLIHLSFTWSTLV